MISKGILLTIVLAPLFGAIVAGLFGRWVGRAGAHTVTIAGVALSCALSFYVLYLLVWGGAPVYNQNVYEWFHIGNVGAHADIGAPQRQSPGPAASRFRPRFLQRRRQGSPRGEPARGQAR